MRPSNIFSRLFTAFAVIAITAPSLGLADEPVREPSGDSITVEAQPLATALQAFSEQSGLQIAYVATLADNVSSKGTEGADTPVAALSEILESTGLEYQFVNNDTVAIGPGLSDAGSGDSGNSRPASSQVMMAQNQAPAEEKRSGTESEDDEEEVLQPERITVTGTHIRGFAPDSSPTRTFTREDIQISGAATAQDFIQTLTTNFGGGANSDISAGLPGDASSSNNNRGVGALGSSVNLRGLGSGSTLVLLNGHRVAPSSAVGDFTDISMIPASAIERVEVLNDGASSIYGGDAVAGVVNFILRDDYDGFEASFRYGLGTQGRSPKERRASMTAGLNWDSGHALAVYEYFNRDQIGAADRDFSQGAFLPNDLEPSQERHSVLASLSQTLTANLETFADLTFSTRDAVHRNTQEDGVTLSTSTPSWETLSVSTGASYKLSDTWFVDLSGTHSFTQGTTELDSNTFGYFRRDVDSKISSGDLKASGTLFPLPGGDVKLAVGGHYRTESFSQVRVDLDELVRDAKRDVYSLFGEAVIPIIGSGNAVPGIERLELNVSGRLDDYSDFGSTTNPKLGILWSPTESLKLRSSYGTSFNPPPLGRVGSNDLALFIYTTAWINDLFGGEPADPSIADVLILQAAGTDQNLDAENSRTFTGGIDFSEEWGRHGLNLSVSYFDINFENRLGTTPVPNNESLFIAPSIKFEPRQK